MSSEWQQTVMRNDPDASTARIPQDLVDWLLEDHRFDFLVLVKRDLLGSVASWLEQKPQPGPVAVTDPPDARRGRQRLVEAALRGDELIIGTHATADEIRRLLMSF